jgi:hypothetical protein
LVQGVDAMAVPYCGLERLFETDAMARPVNLHAFC